MIYLDNASTTFPKPECVYDAVDRFNRTAAVNAGRSSYHMAKDALRMIQSVKKELLGMCNARNKASVVLTPSVTVSINQIINGQSWHEGMNAYVSPYEHNAVLRPLHLMKKKYHINVIELPLKENLSIDLEKTAKLFRNAPPDFVSVSAISNVTGYCLPYRSIFSLAKEYNAFTLLDAAQAMGLLKFSFSEESADAIAFAGHKTLYATFGIAGFYLRYGAELDEFIVGGNGISSMELDMPLYMPEKLESASMNTPAIAGLAASLKWLRTADLKQYEEMLMEHLIAGLQSVSGLKLYKAPEGLMNQGPVISFNIADVPAGVVGLELDRKFDIAVRAGHHCAAFIHKHLQNEINKGTVRVSIGAFTTKEDIDLLIAALKEIDSNKLKNLPLAQLIATC